MKNFVSFELAKLLKEKGFDNPVLSYYDRDRFCLNYSIINQYDQEYIEDKGDCLIIPYTSGEGSLSLETINFNGWGVNNYSAPTIAEVIMWLYEKHGIWISVELIDNTKEFYFQPTIWTSKDREYHDEDMVDQAKSICKWKEWKYNSPTEAYEAAIAYILNKLIEILKNGNNS